MNKITYLLLAGLLACIPQPKSIEAPVAVNILPLPKTEARLELPVSMPKWRIQRLWNPDAEEIIVNPTKIIYLANGSKITVTSMPGGRIFLACENGISAVAMCSTEGHFNFSCNDMTLRLDCAYKKILNGVEEEEPNLPEESETQ